MYLIVVAGMAMRGLWIAFYSMEPFGVNASDAMFYLDTACNIASGSGYSINGQPTAYFPVGYSLYLSLYFKLLGSCTFKLAQIANLLPAAIIVVGTYWIMAFFSKDMARLGLCIIALSPSQIVWSGITMSEVFFTALLVLTTLGFFMVMNNRHGAREWMALTLVGLAGGGSTLTRTQGIVLLPFFIMLLILTLKSVTLKRRISMAVFLVLVWALPITPWMARNHNLMGTWSLATNGGINFYIGANQGATGGYHIPTTLTLIESGAEATKDKKYFREGLAYVLQNPLSYVSMIPNKILRVWLPDSVLTFRHDLSNKLFVYFAYLIIASSQLLHLALLGLIAYGLLKRPKFYVSTMAFVVWGVVISGSMVYAFFFGGSRYNYPMAPFIVMLALLPWVDLYSTSGRRLIEKSDTLS
jgi:4-amino-4-deoxy-L-arabinose transferase-like glycosyltransferase